MNTKEDKDHDTSAEDLLGPQSLLLSESEGDCQEDESLKHNTNDEEIDGIKNVKSKNIKKISVIVDTDSDSEENIETFSLSKHNTKPEVNNKKHLIDSESDEYENISSPKQCFEKREEKIASISDIRKPTPLNTESEEENSHNVRKKKKIKTKKLKKKNTELLDSESELESEHMNVNKICASDTQEEVKRNENKKTIRASAKRANEEIQVIQSEQQRLHREASLSIPYHKPKKRTLQEFLKRRTVIHPQIPIKSLDVPHKNLKMSPDELEEYAKLMENRAKEATDFFKSESDDNEKEVNSDISIEMCEHKLSGKNICQCKTSPNVMASNGENPVTFKNDNNINTENSKITKLVGFVPTSEIISTTNLTITNVIELPRLDLHEMNILNEEDVSKSSHDIKSLILDNKLTDSPTIRGDSNMLIDLETGDLFAKKPTGPDHLLQRLLLTNRTSTEKSTELVNIISTDNGKLEIIKANVNITNDYTPNKEQKPGAAFLKLKENLKSVITKKRLEDMQRKQENNACSNNDYDVEEKLMDSESGKNMEEKYSIEDKISNNIDSDEECTENDDMELSDIENTKSTLDFQEEFEDHLSNINNERSPSYTIEKLAQTSECKTLPHDEENELLGLCSGDFGATQKPNIAIISQIPITQQNSKNDNVVEELLQLCSGTFENQNELEIHSISNEVKSTQDSEIPKHYLTEKINFISSDDESVVDVLDKKNHSKKLSKEIKKGKIKLGFSDDENEDSDKQEIEQENDMQEIEPEDEEEMENERFVDYDSEENEILVEMTKNQCIKHAQKYLENEAELSESDWGSADEDETLLDKYDIELGDEEEFDQEKLQTKLGQIHARKMLDDDIKEIRKIQDMLFEDEENDGVGLQRQFRWKNADSSFCLEHKNIEDTAEGDNHNTAEEENEHIWRKIRFEREQILKEQCTKGLNQNEDSVPLNTTSFPLSNSAISNPKISVNNLKKINLISVKKDYSIESKNDAAFLISKRKIVQNIPKRGSFLTQNKEILTKLAGNFKNSNDSDAAGTVSIKSVKPKNFVFATLTEEEHENLKRKADDLLNSSSDNGTNFMKKLKKEAQRENCIIDLLNL